MLFASNRALLVTRLIRVTLPIALSIGAVSLIVAEASVIVPRATLRVGLSKSTALMALFSLVVAAPLLLARLVARLLSELV